MASISFKRPRHDDIYCIYDTELVILSQIRSEEFDPSLLPLANLFQTLLYENVIPLRGRQTTIESHLTRWLSRNLAFWSSAKAIIV